MARAGLAQRPWVEHIRPPQERLCRTAPEITPGDCRTWSVKDPATAFEELGPHCGDASQRERLSRSDSRCRTVAAERLRSRLPPTSVSEPADDPFLVSALGYLGQRPANRVV